MTRRLGTSRLSPFSMATIGSVFALASLTAFGEGCKRPSPPSVEPDRTACVGEVPVCYTAAADGCCVDPTQPAECGPKDAPVGTHLRWVCPGEATLVSGCRGIGAACAPKTAGRDPTTLPHAVVPIVTTDMEREAGAARPTSEGLDAGKPKPEKAKRRH